MTTDHTPVPFDVARERKEQHYRVLTAQDLDVVGIVAALAVCRSDAEIALTRALAEVERLQKNADHCSFSTGIGGEITAGRGRLGDNGYWEFPCVECVQRAEFRMANEKKAQAVLDAERQAHQETKDRSALRLQQSQAFSARVASIAIERDAAEQRAARLAEVIREYLEWGAMTGSDRDWHEQKFRAALADHEPPAPTSPSLSPSLYGIHESVGVEEPLTTRSDYLGISREPAPKEQP